MENGNKTDNKTDTGAAVWASIRQAERHAHVTNGTIRAAVKRGEIKAYKRHGGKGAILDLRDVDAWIRTTWTEPTANAYAGLTDSETIANE